MKKIYSISVLLPGLSLALLLLSGSTLCMAEVTDIPQAELMQRIKADRAGLILDVRSHEEFAEGHVPGAVNIPYDQLGSRLAEISSHKDREIVLYCKSGKRAGIAAKTLEAAGFSKLLHLKGDMSAWASNGMPVKK